MSIFCPQAQYVLKTDDDIYVNVDLLHRSLLEESKTLSQNIHGKIIASIMANLEMTKNIQLKMRKILPFEICQSKINSRSVAGLMGQMNRLMFQVLFFFMISCRILCKNTFNLFVYFFKKIQK